MSDRTLISLKFLGGVASDNLTGSCMLLNTRQGKRNNKLLIDAGLIQGCFHKSLDKNREILEQFNPREKDTDIIITHAHIDHTGRLPLFTRHGFLGKIICTEGTADLLTPMLEDSAKIQTAEAAYLFRKLRHSQKDFSHKLLAYGTYDRNRLKNKQHKSSDELSPLYTIKDVEVVEGLIKNGGHGFFQWENVAYNISVKFYPSGHVMGGAIVVLRIISKPKDIYFCFTGDLGRRDGIILPPPVVVEEPIDYFIIESTYGGKTHPERDQEIQKLFELIKQAAITKLRLLIPSFALERAQEIIYLLSYHMALGDIPYVPIYLDSPLAEKITAVFSKGWRQGMFSDQARLYFNPFDPATNPYLHIITSQEESDALITRSGSSIEIAGSGACDAGRIRSKLKAHLGNANTVVCLVGYMPENSLGRKLKDGFKAVKMNGKEVTVKANIVSFDSFSAHADGPFLEDYTLAVQNNNPASLKKIFIVHGETKSSEDLQAGLLEIFTKSKNKTTNIIIPKLNQEFICD